MHAIPLPGHNHTAQQTISMPHDTRFYSSDVLTINPYHSEDSQIGTWLYVVRMQYYSCIVYLVSPGPWAGVSFFIVLSYRCRLPFYRYRYRHTQIASVR